LANKGDIDAVYSLLPSDTMFGPQFSFTPAQGIVVPGGYQAIQVHVVHGYALSSSLFSTSFRVDFVGL
jgi:hypothetical protein